MSLSLNDLKKPVRPIKTELKTSSTMTAHPWTHDGLVLKGQKARKPRAEHFNAAMNDEWVNDHTSSLSAFDMEVQSALTQLIDLQMSLKEQAVEIERKIKRAAMSPFHILRSVLSLVQK